MSIVAALVLLASAGAPQGAAEAFTRMKLLEGSWKGTFAWTGARSDRGEMAVRYHLTGYGSALIEDLGAGDKPAMTSVYHLDNGALRMTHYCGANNQPRLRADEIDLDQNTFHFDFVDATNLATPDAPHVHGFTMRMVDKTHLELEFVFDGKGKRSIERIVLTRVAA